MFGPIRLKGWHPWLRESLSLFRLFLGATSERYLTNLDWSKCTYYPLPYFLRADTQTMVVDDTHVHVIRLSGLLSLLKMLFKDWNRHFLFALGNERTLVTCKSCEARRVRRRWETRGGRWKWGGGGRGENNWGKGRKENEENFCARAQPQEGRREVRERDVRCLPPCPSLTDVFRCPRVGVGSTRKSPSCPWRWYPASGLTFETAWTTVPSHQYIAEISMNVTLHYNKTKPKTPSFIALWA